MFLLLKNIMCLVGIENNPQPYKPGKKMADLDTISDAFLLIRDGHIYDFGHMSSLKLNDLQKYGEKINVMDIYGRHVFPSFCDSHTHLVFAGSREKEFADKIRGLSYEEIARRGGGILNSASILHNTSEDDLYCQSAARIDEIIGFGTGAVEIKSGYGLNTQDEIKILRVIKRIKKNYPLEIKATFLGAHAIPSDFISRRDDYINIVINEMIPQVASDELADYIDVFCDKGFFTESETEKILMAGMKYGLVAKLHANELDFSGGVQIGVKYNALSVDHLERAGDREIKILRNSGTMPTLLPGSAFFLGLPYPPARRMIDAGLPLALASDFNPGSSPSGNMKMVLSLGCIKLKMLPEEVINAATINSAYAMGLSSSHGSIARGKVANVFVTKEIPSYTYFPYSYGSNLIEKVILKGTIVNNPL
jgi:imidazolonepropionase